MGIVNLIKLIKIYNGDSQANTIEILLGSTIIFAQVVNAGQSIVISESVTNPVLGYTPLNPANNLTDVSNTSTSLSNLGGVSTSRTINGTALTSDISLAISSMSDYSTGTWTPIDASGASLSFTIQSAIYTKLNNIIAIEANIVYPSTSNTNAAIIGGLPYTSRSSNAYTPLSFVSGCLTLSAAVVQPNNTIISLLTNTGISPPNNLLNNAMSGLYIQFSGIYFI